MEDVISSPVDISPHVATVRASVLRIPVAIDTGGSATVAPTELLDCPLQRVSYGVGEVSPFGQLSFGITIALPAQSPCHPHVVSYSCKNQSTSESAEFALIALPSRDVSYKLGY